MAQVATLSTFQCATGAHTHTSCTPVPHQKVRHTCATPVAQLSVHYNPVLWISSLTTIHIFCMSLHLCIVGLMRPLCVSLHVWSFVKILTQLCHYLCDALKVLKLVKKFDTFTFWYLHLLITSSFLIKWQRFWVNQCPSFHIAEDVSPLCECEPRLLFYLMNIVVC